MKTVLWLLMIGLINSNAQTIEIKAGRTLFPADYVCLRYAHYSNSAVNICGSVFLEKTKTYGLAYTAMGADLLAQYDMGLGENSDHRFECKLGLGGSFQVEQEPWVYKDWNFQRRMNYGVLAEVAGEWMMTQTFGLCGLLQQKFLFNKDLGHTRFAFGIGLSYHFNNN